MRRWPRHPLLRGAGLLAGGALALLLPLLLLLLLLLAPGQSQAAAEPAQPEAVLKAQFFERFTRFVIWPGLSSPFVVCLAGDSRLSAEIERMVLRRSFKQNPAQVRRLRLHPDIDPRGCHALYIDEVARPFLGPLLARTRGAAILTVSDSPGFCQRGVLINMYVEDGFVRFEINGSVARATRLQLSSQLLRLARIIEAVPGG